MKECNGHMQSIFLTFRPDMFVQSQFFNDKDYLLYYNVAVYILIQSEEEYSLIWKAKPLTIQTDKGK